MACYRVLNLLLHGILHVHSPVSKAWIFQRHRVLHGLTPCHANVSLALSSHSQQVLYLIAHVVCRGGLELLFFVEDMETV